MRVAGVDFAFPLLSHERALDLVAMLELDGVDLALMGNRSHVRPEQVSGDVDRTAERLRALLGERGLEVSDAFFIPWSDFETMAPNHPDAGERARAASLCSEMLDLAAAVGAHGFTLLPGIHWPDESWEQSLARSVEELKHRVDEGRSRGLRVSVEPHVGSIADTPEKAHELVARCPGLELTLDYTHFVFQGIAIAEIDSLMPHARHFHARGGTAAKLQTTLRESEIDYGHVLDVMAATGYDGFFAVEYVWTPGDPPGGPYDLTNTDNVSETILLRDLARSRSSIAA